MKRTLVFLLIILSGTLISLNYESDKLLKLEEMEDRELPVFMRQSPQWALDKLSAMTLDEKIAQSFMVEVTPRKGVEHLKIIDSLVRVHHIGGIIMFQGNVAQTKEAIQSLQRQSEIPLLVGIDGEWGSNMRLSDGERFPFQLTMGAANQLKSTKIIGQAMGKEMRALGIHVNFSPVVDINSNPENPVIGFRSFGENPVLVSQHSMEMIKGMQEYNVLTCMKHFPGHGDTDIDSHLELPTIHKTKTELNRIDWLPYKQGRLIGASAVMVGHLNIPALDSSGLPATLSPIIIKTILRKELKFKGLIFSDALNMKALTNKYDEIEIVKRAYIAGNDILLYPSKIKESIEAIKFAVKNGEISEEEVNEKTLRILRAKYFTVHLAEDIPTLSSEEVEYAKINIYEKALVVLKNEDVIPLKDASGKNMILNIGGEGTAFNLVSSYYVVADKINVQSIQDISDTLLAALEGYQHVFINLIAPSVLPRNDFSYPKGWREFLLSLPEAPEIYVTLFGNPYAVKDHLPFDKIDAVILSFQNSEIGQNRAAQLIFGGFQAASKLPITLSADYPEGFGIQTQKASRLKFTVPMELGISDTAFNRIDSIVLLGMEKKAYPGCQVVIAKEGKVIYQKSFGYYTYEKQQEVSNHTLYDLASITKIASSVTGLMFLQDQGVFSLDSTLGKYLNNPVGVTPYKNLKMKEILAHQAGLVPWIPFYKSTLVNGFPDTLLYASQPVGDKTAVVSDHLFLKKGYEDEMIEKILYQPLRVKSYKYSDIGYYFIKKIIENTTDQKLNVFVKEQFYAPMGLTSMTYLPLESFSKSQIAPSEQDNYFRHQTIQGYVHDMGAAMQGGVGGHAGLFSDATDVAGYMQMLLNKGVYGGKRYLSEAVIDQYTSCQYCPSNRRGAGFDRPVSGGGKGPTTEKASKKSFGHTGFTGTMAWADPVNNINYVFLSNRTYPSAENWELTKLNIRTEIQKVIYEILQ